MRNVGQPIFVFALTVILIIALGGGYMMIKFPDRFFKSATKTKAMTELQEIQEEAAPSAQELSENLAHNVNLFNEDATKEILSTHGLGIAFIPSRSTYVEFTITDPNNNNTDAQYVPGPENDIIVVQGGNFEFSDTLFYNRPLTQKDLPKLIERIAYRINLVSDAMTVVKDYAAKGKVSDKILRYVVSDEDTGLMHFITECSEGDSCQFELNTVHQMLTVLSP